MLRAAVLLALVAFVCAQSSPFNYDSSAPAFATANTETFIPIGNNILIKWFPAKNGQYYRVISSNQAVPDRVNSVRTYFGEAGRERFQDEEGRGIIPQSHLVLGQDNIDAVQLVDPRFRESIQEVTTNKWLSVANYQRRLASFPINSGDIIVAVPGSAFPTRPALPLNGDMGGNFFVISTDDVAATYQFSLRNGGDEFPDHILATA